MESIALNTYGPDGPRLFIFDAVGFDEWSSSMGSAEASPYRYSKKKEALRLRIGEKSQRHQIIGPKINGSSNRRQGGGGGEPR